MEKGKPVKRLYVVAYLFLLGLSTSTLLLRAESYEIRDDKGIIKHVISLYKKNDLISLLNKIEYEKDLDIEEKLVRLLKNQISQFSSELNAKDFFLYQGLRKQNVINILEQNVNESILKQVAQESKRIEKLEKARQQILELKPKEPLPSTVTEKSIDTYLSQLKTLLNQKEVNIQNLIKTTLNIYVYISTLKKESNTESAISLLNKILEIYDRTQQPSVPSFLLQSEMDDQTKNILEKGPLLYLIFRLSDFIQEKNIKQYNSFLKSIPKKNHYSLSTYQDIFSTLKYGEEKRIIDNKVYQNNLFKMLVNPIYELILKNEPAHIDIPVLIKKNSTLFLTQKTIESNDRKSIIRTFAPFLRKIAQTSNSNFFDDETKNIQKKLNERFIEELEKDIKKNQQRGLINFGIKPFIQPDLIDQQYKLNLYNSIKKKIREFQASLEEEQKAIQFPGVGLEERTTIPELQKNIRKQQWYLNALEKMGLAEKEYGYVEHLQKIAARNINAIWSLIRKAVGAVKEKPEEEPE